MLQAAALAEVVLCYVLWVLAFVGARRVAAGQKKVVRAPASKWGIILQGIGFTSACVYVRPEGFEKSTPSLAASMLLAPVAVALAWAATRHLGKHWRLEAALSQEHELIQSGPYRWMRHPIYASMLVLLLAIGGVWTWWPMLLAGLAFYLAGTEIRVHAEERLLAERFGEAFRAYQSRVRAYIPFVR